MQWNRLGLNRMHILRDTHHRFRRRITTPKFIPPLRKDAIEIILAPSDLGTQTREFPFPVHLLVPVLIGRVRVAFDGYLGHGSIRIFLMWDPELMPPDNLVIADFLPARAADEVLGLEERIAEDFGIRGHGYEVFGRHGFPFFVQEGAVIDLDCVSLVWRCEKKRRRRRYRAMDVREVLVRCIFGGDSSLWNRSYRPIRSRLPYKQPTLC